MKKVLIVLAVLISSCSKEDDTPQPVATPTQSSCNCGKVLSDSAQDFSVFVKNNCTGNTKTIYLSEADWMEAYVGSEICISNLSSWKN